MLRPDTFALTVLLGLLTAAAPLSVDMYLPSLPEIGRSFGASVPQVQLTLSVFLFGFAFSQIVYGPVSDHVGRKPVLVAALALYTAASLGCALAPSIEALIALRGVQAVGVAGAPVLARAIVRDLYEGARAGRELSLMASIMAFAPVLAPAAGGVLQSTVGWQANFVVHALFGATVLLVVLRLMPETMRRAAPEALSLGAIVRGYASFFGQRGFLIYTAIVAAGYGGLFAWISGSSFALQNIYGFSPAWFGFAFAITACGYLAGTLVAAKLVTRLGLDRTIVCGAAAMCAGGVLMTAAIALDLHSLVALVAPATLYIVGLGLGMPQAMAGALTQFPERAGSASSLLGFVQQVVASSTGIAAGLALGASALPLGAIIAAMGAAALLLALLNQAMCRAA
jgi:DHA1 family bicyclomycin/chloramphenicol resistance-like MFS transporter